mmetsp:Transcript_46006/g.107003  ORF Transcript_46006/g.107003 Transcript_46006/m.107003 type:complete len:531 (+) Transcript_46006:50-1642(+)
MAGILSLATCILCILCILCPWRCSAWQFYQDRIPNGDSVTRFGQPWAGVGHDAAGGATPRNPFGLAFAAANHQWTMELCQEDSDGDGQSNGYELGDPRCVWTSGDTPERTIAISHPGYSDTYVDDTTNITVVSAGDETTEAATDATTVPSTTVAAVEGPCGPGASSVQRLGTGETYDCVATVGDFQLHWSITGSNTLDFAMVRSMSSGYMALAWPGTASGMNGPSFIITATGDVGRYSLSPGVASATSDVTLPFPVDSTSEEEVTLENGMVIRRFFGADMEGVNVGADFTNSVKMIWATKDSDGISYHDARGEATVNFASGASSSSAGASIEDDVKLHGILQITAWCFLAPSAVFLKRLGARVPAFQKMLVPGVKLPLPYVAHVVIMLSAIGCSLSAVGIAKDKFTAEVDYGHGVTAMIAVAMMLFQPLPAFLWQFCKPKPDSDNFAKAKQMFGAFHRMFGISIMIIAAVTVFTGINNYRDIYMDEEQADTFFIMAIIGLAAIGSLPCFVEIINRAKRGSPVASNVAEKE